MEYTNLIVESADSIAVLTINRPNQLNALNSETISELSNAFKTLEDDKNIKVIIVTGSGTKAFIAGADIKEFYQFNIEQGAELSSKGHHTLFDLVQNLNKPVIGAINGFALGGGLELAMSCHFRLASDNAKLGLPEVTLGVIPGYGGTQRLAQLVGKGRAMEMVVSAKMISAEEALNYGLVNYVTSQEELLETCKKIALKIVKNSSVAIAGAIRAINAGYTDGINGFEKEIEEFGKCFGTKDFKEGTTAFIEKRKADFPGE
jgi:enoyl-CoA hydratase